MDPKDNLQTAQDLFAVRDLLVGHLEWLKKRKDKEAVAKLNPIVRRFKALARRIAEENLLAVKDTEEEVLKIKQMADTMSKRIEQMESAIDNDIIARLARGQMIKPKDRA